MARKLKRRLWPGSLTTYGLIIPGVALLVIALLAVTAPDTQAQEAPAKKKNGYPQNAQIATRSSDMITVTWEAPSGRDCTPNSYYLTLINNDNPPDYATLYTIYPPAELKKVFKGLEPKTYYKISLSAFSPNKGCGANGWSGLVINATTKKAAKAPATTTVPSSTPEPTATPRGILEIIPSNDKTEEQAGLTPTPVRNWTVVTPKKPQKTTVISPPVTNLRISAISANTTTIAWDDADLHSSSEGCSSANPRVYRYTVMDMDKTGKDAKRILKRITTKDTSVTLTGLRPGGNYWIIVKSKGTPGCEAKWTDYRSPRITWTQRSQ